MENNIKLLKSNRTNKDFLVLSCIGIIIVVSGHCGCNFLDVGSLIPYYNFHMPLFVFISGYFFHCQKSAKDWFIHKLKKLIIPYYLINIVFCFISFFLYSQFNFNLTKKVTLKSLLLEPLYPKTLSEFNSATWFVINLFYIEVIYFLIMKFIKIKHKEIIFACFFFCIGNISIYMSMEKIWISGGGQKNVILMNILRTLCLLPFFSFGNIYNKFIENKTGLKKIQIFLIVIFILLLTYQIYPDYFGKTTIDYKQCSYSYLLPTYIVGLCGIIFWLQVSKLLSPTIGNSNIINIIGNNTFSIMAYHLFGFFCINGAMVILNKYFSISSKINIETFLEKPRVSAFANELNTWYYLIFSIIISLLLKRSIDILKNKIIKLAK